MLKEVRYLLYSLHTMLKSSIYTERERYPTLATAEQQPRCNESRKDRKTRKTTTALATPSLSLARTLPLYLTPAIPLLRPIREKHSNPFRGLGFDGILPAWGGTVITAAEDFVALLSFVLGGVLPAGSGTIVAATVNDLRSAFPLLGVQGSSREIFCEVRMDVEGTCKHPGVRTSILCHASQLRTR